MTPAQHASAARAAIADYHDLQRPLEAITAQAHAQLSRGNSASADYAAAETALTQSTAAATPGGTNQPDLINATALARRALVLALLT